MSVHYPNGYYFLKAEGHSEHQRKPYGIISFMAKEPMGLNKIPELADEATTEKVLRSAGISDWKSAGSILRRLEKGHPQGVAAIFPYLLSVLGGAADPLRSLINFERLADGSGKALFEILGEQPRVIEMLVTIFSVSPFLTEIILRDPQSIELLHNRAAMTDRKTIDQFQAEATSAYQFAESDIGKLETMRRYQRQQLLRIGTSDFLGLYDLRTVFSQLSRMAVGLVRTCLALAVEQTSVTSFDFSILALGKLGGWELNYSSDIDLVLVVRKELKENTRLAKQFIENIVRNTPEGFLYRVDLRLRPWGNDGPLISSLDAYVHYMQSHARLWEKQAFLKSRVIAGNLSLGEELRREVEPLIFQTPPEEVRSGILAMKFRTEEFLREKGRKWGEVKLGEGSIRDIEFVVQSLQLINPSVRTRATLKAIHQLHEKKLLTTAEEHVLSGGYVFLRTTEHYLQMIDNRQTYTLPTDPIAIDLLARRLGFESEHAGEEFVERYDRHCVAIRSIFLKYVGNEFARDVASDPDSGKEVLEHVGRMDVSYSAIFSQDEIRRHAKMAEDIGKDSPAVVEARLVEDKRWRVTVVGYDYLGELSIICGLLFVYGMDIIDSHVFTYEPAAQIGQERSQTDSGEQAKTQAAFQTHPMRGRPRKGSAPKANDRQKIVDVFTVRPVGHELVTEETWKHYASDLQDLLNKLCCGQRREAQGDLAKRVGAVFQGDPTSVAPLHPIEIDIDNEESERYTVLKINTPDTVGFLYELSNALALNHINIARMDVRSIGKRVHDTIFVTDEKSQKIVSPERQRELRAAIVLIKHFTHLLPHSPNPEAALLHFREFLGQLFTRPNWPDELSRLERPEVLDALAQLLGISDFLWDDFLRMQYSNLFPIVRDVDELTVARKYDWLKKELDDLLIHASDWREVLNAFKDREMFRIDMRHILGHTSEFWDFSTELSDLVELVVEVTLIRCYEELSTLYGKPLLADGNPCPATIFALGKFGGRELGFASDIELMLIYAGQGETTGPRTIPASEYYEDLIQNFVTSIRSRQEGIFHIDLQLRPYGKAGSMAVTLEAFQRYYAPDGPAWAYERQALVKMRLVTGDSHLAERVCELRDSFVYKGNPFDVTAMRAMRERQIRHFVSAGTFNAKYSPGGLVDLEYLVQGLQIRHGADNNSLRAITNIRQTMAILHEAGFLTDDQYTRLRKAHTFLRWLIDFMRVVRGNTRDVNVPAYASEEFAFLARRLRYGNDKSQLNDDLARYSRDVQDLSQNLLD